MPVSYCNITLFKLHRSFPWSYVGRKRLQIKHPEHWVEGVKSLVSPDYSYWTLGYALTLKGAQKLLDAQPLGKMLPVDEFLPVMFNKHPKWVLLSIYKFIIDYLCLLLLQFCYILVKCCNKHSNHVKSILSFSLIIEHDCFLLILHAVLF